MANRNWRTQVKTLLAVVWLVFTFSIVAWWLTYSLQRHDLTETARRMFAWEGSILLAAVLIGGGVMVFLTYRDEQRQHRLQFFFSTFSHDIKTSIARLRLQAEVLEEDTEQIKNPVFRRLLHDIARLDLQLENSLLLSNMNEGLFVEDIQLSSLIQLLRNDFSDLNIELNQNAILKTDKRAFLSVIRNLFHNAVLHGQATMVQIQIHEQGKDVVVAIQDNGSGFKGDIRKLGKEILRSKSSCGNGIGLLLSKRLMNKMHGELKFIESSAGFRSEIRIPGRPS